MTWVYKSKYKLDEKPEVAEILPICSKCHYILQLRPGEKAAFCPMCGEQHFKDKTRKEKSNA